MATLKELLADETTAKEFFAQETEEAALAFLQSKGVEISPEMGTELKEVFAAVKKVPAGELSESDLEKVAGGEIGDWLPGERVVDHYMRMLRELSEARRKRGIR